MVATSLTYWPMSVWSLGSTFSRKQLFGLRRQTRRSRKQHGAGILLLAAVIVGLAASFSAIVAQGSSTRFMLDYGDQWPAALYSSVQFLYIGFVVSVTGITCFRFRGDMLSPYFRASFTLIGVGCVFAVFLVILVLVMDVLHLQGRLNAMRSVSPIYDAAFVAAMLFLCVGLAIPPVARRVLRRKQSATEEELVSDLTRIWEIRPRNGRTFGSCEAPS